MSGTQSVSHWIADLKEGNSTAVQQLWDRYALRLVQMAELRLKNTPKRVADEEDVAASVFYSLCRGAAAGRFQNVKNRDDLWWLLLGITKQKIVDHVRREMTQKRGSGCVQVESALKGSANLYGGFSFDNLVGEEPTPESLLMLEEQHQRLLDLLRDDRLRQIALMRVEGYTVAEIADRLQVSSRSIERKLQLIRSMWANELSS